MLEEYSISTADGSLSVAHGIEGETDAWSGVEEVTLHTTLVGSAGNRGIWKSGCTYRTSCSATVHHAIKGITPTIQRSAKSTSVVAIDVIDQWSVRQAPRCGIKVERLVVTLAIGPEETESYSQVQSQSFGRMEIILEVRLQNFIAVVILSLRTGQREVRDIA